MVRRRQRRFDLRKALFVLPNAFTVSSICCGIYAIILASGDATPDHMLRAAIAIFFGVFFDAMDGRVARLTRTQSDFGVEIDSLADVITFGVAPAILVYNWGLEPLGKLGLVATFIYTGCGAIRLARFNVIARHSPSVTEHFIGLPIPLAAGTIVSLVIAHHSLRSGDVVRHGSVVALVLVLSYLMVSNVRYRTFKGARLSVRALAVLAGVILTLTVVFTIIGVSAALILVAMCGMYILLGLLEEVLFFKRRRVQERERKADPGELVPHTPPGK